MNSTERSLTHNIAQYLYEQQIPPGSHFLVALSGGPDSTALLLAVNELKSSLGCTISAAYVNHGMRGEEELADDDNFVLSLADKLNIELHVKRMGFGEIEKIAVEEGRSSEEVARQIRYEFFNSLLPLYDHPYIMLGHNRDDQFETILTRFLQGSGFSGLKGIPHRNGSILRPLIHCPKGQIISFLEERRQSWRHDSSNDGNRYLRNRVRNRLLPIIGEIFPGYESALSSQHERFSLLDNYLHSRAEELHVQYSSEKSSVTLDSFNRSNRFVRLNVLYGMFDRIYSGGIQGFRIPEAFFNPLLDRPLVEGETYARAHGVLLFSDDEFLHMIPAEGDQSGFFAIFENDDLSIPGRYFVKRGSSGDIEIPVVDNSPLILRSAAPGDFIETEKGRKALKDIFKRWKLLHPHLNPPPVLEDSRGIAALIGAPDGYENIVRKKKIITSRKFNILYLEVGRV